MIAALVAVVLLFGLCVAEAVTGLALTVERDALRDLRASASPTVDSTMRLVSRFGGGAGVAAAAPVVLGWLLARRRWLSAAVFAVSVAGAALGPLLKELVRRPRPRLWAGVDQMDGWSFPSGHAISSAAFVSALVAVVWATRWRWPMLVCGAVLVVLVGLARVELGVHYPSDVVGGWSMAVGWVIGVHLGVRRLEARRRLRRSGSGKPVQTDRSNPRLAVSDP